MSKTSQKPDLITSTGGVPASRKHKTSGEAVVSLPMDDGRRKDVYLGKYGTKKSRIAYAQVVVHGTHD
jgi:hypothetical protein